MNTDIGERIEIFTRKKPVVIIERLFKGMSQGIELEDCKEILELLGTRLKESKTTGQLCIKRD